MKTEGLNFLEALRALRAGKCEKIGIGGVQYEINRQSNPNGILSCIDLYMKDMGVKLSPDFFLLPQWKLIGVKSRTEERVGYCWLVVCHDGSKCTYSQEPSREVYEEAQHVLKFSRTYIYTYPEEA